MRNPQFLLRIILPALIFTIPFLISAPAVQGQQETRSSIHQEQDKEFRDQNFSFAPEEKSQSPQEGIGGPSFTGPNLLKEVMGFAPYWSLSSVKNYDFTYISIVAYFGVDIDGNSGNLITTNSGWSGWASADRATLVANAHAKGAKVVLTAKLFDTLNSGGTQTLGGFLANPTSQQTAITQIISEVKAKGVDGVNVDFEPIDSSSATTAQKSAFATFLTNLSNQLRAEVANAHITVDTYACSARGSTPCSTNSFFDPAALAATPIDAMMVMAYDFYSPNSSIIAPTSPLNGFGSTYWYDVTTAVNDYLAKAPGDKIILGVPYYGVKLSTNGNGDNASSLGNGANPSYAQTQTDIACTGATQGWDNAGKVARAYWFSDSSKSGCGTVWNQWRQVYFDNATSLGMKYDLVNAKNLRGIGIWALGYDGAYYSDLVAPIKQKLSTIYQANYDFNTMPKQVFAGQTVTASLKVTNTSPDTWGSGGANPFRLSYHWYDSAGRVVAWEGNRFDLPADLSPGQSVTLTGSIAVPTTPGNYSLRWDMLQEYITWFSWRGEMTYDIDVNVMPARYNDMILGYAVPSRMKAGTTVSVPVHLRNLGLLWNNSGQNAVTLSYHWINPDGSIAAWEGLRTALPNDVDHLDYTSVNANIAVPSTPGSYILRFDMVKELITWFSWQGAINYEVRVDVVSPSPNSLNAIFSENSTPIFMTSGKSYTGLNFKVINNGSETWTSGGGNPVSLGYHFYNRAGQEVIWEGLRTGLAADLAPGNTATFSASLNAPGPGSYIIRWDMVKEMVTWFEWAGSRMLEASVVVLPSYGYQFRTDYTPSVMNAGATNTIRVKLQNLGSTTWTNSGPNPVSLSYHWFDTSFRVVAWEGLRSTFAADVSPLGQAEVDAQVIAPSIPGNYILVLDMVYENVTWFEWQQAPVYRINVSVR